MVSALAHFLIKQSRMSPSRENSNLVLHVSIWLIM